MMKGLSRRSFLQASAVTVAAAAAGCAAPQGGKKAAMKADTSGYSLDGRIYKGVKGIGKHTAENVLEVYKKYRDLGFDGVESGNPAFRDAYAAATKETGFRFHGLVCPGHWGTRFSDPDPETRSKAVANLERSIRTVHTLGGSAVLVVPGKVGGAKETHADVWGRSIDEIRKVLPLCSRVGVRVLIETVWNGFCLDPVKFRDYIDAYASPWVGAYLDFGNMQKYAPAYEWVRILERRIVKLDVKDWGRKNGFCRLGDGDVDWDRLRGALLEIGYTGWATREGRDQSLEDTSKLMDQLMVGRKC